MSSPYPVLGNRPIDQWKVTELKEELKRRKLTTKGLKDDLIRRLDDALRTERQHIAEAESKKHAVGSQSDIGKPNVARSGDTEITKAVIDVTDGTKVDTLGLQLNSESGIRETDLDTQDQGAKTMSLDNTMADDKKKSNALGLGTRNDVKHQEELLVHKIAGDLVPDEGSCKTVTISSVSSSTLEKGSVPPSLVESKNVAVCAFSEVLAGGPPTSDSVAYKTIELPLENVDLKMQMDKSEPKPLLEDGGLKLYNEDLSVESSSPANQVSEVRPNLGFPVKSDSISTDSVSINEKIELKDNKIDETVKLELDMIQPESVEPSSGDIVPVDGQSHPMDSEEPQEDAVLQEENGINVIDADLMKKNESLDLGDSEKLNLDRSPGDDSMEEDIVDSKQVDSKDQYFEISDRMGPLADKDVNNDEVEIKGISEKQNLVDSESMTQSALPSKKREHHEEESTENVESLKRQRRWNSERINVPEAQKVDHTPTTTPKELVLSASRRNFVRTDSSVNEEATKERVVPPSQKAPTKSLRIDRFLRPFTLKAVHELLGNTGKVEKFWMDQIKTHCYVTYSSVDEALETRNAVYNLQWPPNGGRLLIAEFVDPQEVLMRLEAPPDALASAPVTPNAPTQMGQAQAPQRQAASRQRLPSPPPLPPPPPLSNPSIARDQPSRMLPLPPPEKLEPPIVTLDDLFRKTKATPRIYYLPLSEEQVTAKLSSHGKNAKQ